MWVSVLVRDTDTDADDHDHDVIGNDVLTLPIKDQLLVSH